MVTKTTIFIHQHFILQVVQLVTVAWLLTVVNVMTRQAYADAKLA